MYVNACFLNNSLRPEFAIVIFIHYKPRIARNSRLVVDKDDLKWVANENRYCYYN